MSINIQSFITKLHTSADHKISGGFGSIKGGFSAIVDANGCTNSGTCSGTNVVSCTNSGDCGSASNYSY